MVLSLEHKGQIITQPQTIKSTFLQDMKNILGIDTPIQTYNLSHLYPTPYPLTSLQVSFTLQKIRAITNLAKNKAAGPDGVFNEFAQLY